MTNKERISGVDTAWLRMEQPTNLMMIVGVMMFERKIRKADVKRVLEARFLAFRRFRQCAIEEASGAWWREPEDFDINNHVHRVSLPGKAGKAELEKLVSELASTPLDFGRPLWDFHVVDNYEGSSAVVLRVHHCYADGIALIQVILSLTHDTAPGSLELPPVEPERVSSGDADLLAQLLKPLAGMLGNAREMGLGLLQQGRELATHPQVAAAALEEVARKGMGFVGEVASLALMGPDAPTRFKGKLGKAKRVAWAEPLPLDEVKVVGKALGCSINDVLLSMAAGALRDYLIEKGDLVDGLEIRAIVPVNLRPPSASGGLGNQFGLVFLDLPIGIEHPLERLYAVRSRMLALKGSYQPMIALGLLGAVGLGPKVLQERVTALLGNSASAVMTNVPGPQQPLYFAGQKIRELDFWVPQSGGIGMGVSILSYDGRIQFGVITDVGLVPDPNEIVERFSDEFDQLMWVTLMSPWGTDTGEPASEARPSRPTADVEPATPRTASQVPEAGTQSSRKKIPKRFRNL